MAPAIPKVAITQAAFRSCRTREVICTGRLHDITVLPGGLDADLVEWQAGFLDTNGRFMDRREAAAAVGHVGRIESQSLFAGDRVPTLEAGQAESFQRVA